SGIGCAAELIDFGEEPGRLGKSILQVEQMQVAVREVDVIAANEVGIVKGIDDGDGLAGAGAVDAAEVDGVDAVSLGDLCRRESAVQGRSRPVRWRESEGRLNRQHSRRKLRGKIPLLEFDHVEHES